MDPMVKRLLIIAALVVFCALALVQCNDTGELARYGCSGVVVFFD